MTTVPCGACGWANRVNAAGLHYAVKFWCWWCGKETMAVIRKGKGR